MTRRPACTLNDRTLTLQVSRTEREYLEGLSRLSGLSMSALLRAIVRSFIERVPPERIAERLEQI